MPIWSPQQPNLQSAFACFNHLAGVGHQEEEEKRRKGEVRAISEMATLFSGVKTAQHELKCFQFLFQNFTWILDWF